MSEDPEQGSLEEFDQDAERDQGAFRDHMCVQENGRFSGGLHQAERQLAGFADLDYPQRLHSAFARAAGVLVVNPQIAELVRPHARAVHVVPSGFDGDRFPAGVRPRGRRPGEKLRILFAGLVNEPMKGFGVLHEACRRLWQLRHDFELVVTSDPTGQADEFTRLVGWQTQADLPQVISDCDILAFPTVAQEALGRSAVEAMACGRPVAASRIGGLPWVVEHGMTGLLFEPGNVNELMLSLAVLLDSPALRERMGQAGREKFEREFTWERIIETHYRPLLSRGETTEPCLERNERGEGDCSPSSERNTDTSFAARL